MDRSVRVLVFVGVSAIVALPAGWIATDAIERNNDFCTSCHIDGDVPLHRDVRADFERRPPASMAASHAGAIARERPEDPSMRCIDCHGGVGLLGRAKIKLLAARDAAVWLAGRGEEPTEMRHPLVDADCRQCHPTFDPRVDPHAPEPFHALPVHNIDLGMACVACHTAHVDTGDESFHFLETERVRRRCAHCHSAFEQ